MRISKSGLNRFGSAIAMPIGIFIGFQMKTNLTAGMTIWQVIPIAAISMFFCGSVLLLAGFIFKNFPLCKSKA